VQEFTVSFATRSDEIHVAIFCNERGFPPWTFCSITARFKVKNAGCCRDIEYIYRRITNLKDVAIPLALPGAIETLREEVWNR